MTDRHEIGSFEHLREVEMRRTRQEVNVDPGKAEVGHICAAEIMSARAIVNA